MLPLLARCHQERIRLESYGPEEQGRVSLLMLITRAYGLHSFQVLGAPELNTTRFNIVAKLPSGSSTAQVPEMLKTLLRERFRLAAQQETREFGVYALTAPKPDPAWSRDTAR